MEKTNISNATPRDFIKPVFRHKLIIIITTLVITTGVYVGLLFQTKMYEAKVLIHIKGIVQVEAPTYENIGAFRIHFTQMSIVTSNPVMKCAVQALGLENRPLDYEAKFCHPLKTPMVKWQAAQKQKTIDGLSPDARQKYRLMAAIMNLKQKTETTLRPNTDIFEIAVRDYDPDKAIEIANVLSRSYIIYDLEQQLVELNMKYGDLHPTVQQLHDNIAKMKNNLNGRELSDLDALGSASVKIIEQASSNYLPIGKPKAMIFIVGFLASLAVGFVLAFVIDMYKNTYKSPQDFVEHLNMPVIGTVPRRGYFSRNKIGLDTTHARYEEFMEDLADQTLIFMKVQKLKTLLFVSVDPNSANSTITSNLGYHLSGMGINTLVIDANITSPVINKLLKIEETPGLVDLINDKSRKIEDTIVATEANLSFIPIGAAAEDSSGLIDETSIKSMIKFCKSKYDAVLIDCTLVKKMSDMAVLAAHCDGVILIANEGTDHIQVTRNIITMLNKYNATIVGGILNNRSFPIPQWLYNRI